MEIPTIEQLSKEMEGADTDEKIIECYSKILSIQTIDFCMDLPEELTMNYPDSPGLQLQRERVKNHAQNTGVNLNTIPARCGICGHGRTHKAHGPKCAKENQRRRLAGEL